MPPYRPRTRPGPARPGAARCGVVRRGAVRLPVEKFFTSICDDVLRVPATARRRGPAPAGGILTDATDHNGDGRFGIGALLGRQRGALLAAFGFGAAGNLLLFAGPLYMLQVYDRVLPARSPETLVALSGLVAVLFAAMVGFDLLRQQILTRVALRLAAALEGPALDAALRHPAPGAAARAAEAGRDVEALRLALASPLAVAVGDLPFVPVFLLAVWVLHPALGALALAGVAGLVLLAAVGRLGERAVAGRAAQALAETAALVAAMAAAAGPLRGTAAEPGLAARWRSARSRARVAALDGSRAAGTTAALARGLRHGLQSAVLGLAAALVLSGQLSPGGIVAAMVLATRALAPVDALVAQAGLAARARLAWARLAALLRAAPPPVGRGAAPPRAASAAVAPDLAVRDLLVVAPSMAGAGGTGTDRPRLTPPVLRGVSFDLAPGQALGVIGPAGAGKSALLRALAGAWPVAAGQIRLGGTDPARWPPAALAAAIGYLPERATLPEGPLAQAVARGAVLADTAWPDSAWPDPADLRDALDAAGAAALVRSLPDGLDTAIGPGAAPLSAGQAQRLALARALYGAPGLVLLDAPDAALDADGMVALSAAVRRVTARGGIAVVASQRPQAIEACDLVLVLSAGRAVAFGTREAVLRDRLSVLPASPVGPAAMAGARDGAVPRGPGVGDTAATAGRSDPPSDPRANTPSDWPAEWPSDWPADRAMGAASGLRDRGAAAAPRPAALQRGAA